ncbi:MAG: methionyl-tRNA formyltransferase [Bacillota bacterium]
MKIVYMGTPDFAVPSLEAIIKNGHIVAAAVTQPDKPKGRGKKLSPPPVKEMALQHGIPVFQPKKVKEKDFVQIMKELAPDCIVVVAFGQILPKEILEIPPLGCINVHASLLPKYRGAAPINWAIINNETKTGVTTMYMDIGLDTGDMILKKEIMIREQTAGELHDELAILGSNLLIETLERVEAGTAPWEKQREEDSSYAPIMNKELGRIDWHLPALQIHNLIRGVNPWPTAYSTYQGQTFKIWKTALVEGPCQCSPGSIVRADQNGLLVCCKDSLLLIQEIQFPNSRRMMVDEYLRGHTIQENVMLGE